MQQRDPTIKYPLRATQKEFEGMNMKERSMIQSANYEQIINSEQ